jgi:hypothetical protein
VEPTHFAGPAEFRAWLEEHHDTESELLVGYHKRGSGRPSMTWPESVDEALCFGWIDGLVHPAGIAAFERRTADRTAIYSYEQAEPPELTEDRFGGDVAAWAFFTARTRPAPRR